MICNSCSLSNLSYQSTPAPDIHQSFTLGAQSYTWHLCPLQYLCTYINGNAYMYVDWLRIRTIGKPGSRIRTTEIQISDQIQIRTNYPESGPMVRMRRNSKFGPKWSECGYHSQFECKQYIYICIVQLCLYT